MSYCGIVLRKTLNACQVYSKYGFMPSKPFNCLLAMTQKTLLKKYNRNQKRKKEKQKQWSFYMQVNQKALPSLALCKWSKPEFIYKKPKYMLQSLEVDLF